MQTKFTKQSTGEFLCQQANQAPAPARKASNRNSNSESVPKPSNTRSERSIRSNDVISTPESENPRDIWVISAPMFQAPPTEQEIQDVCKICLLDNEDRTLPRKQHWSETLTHIVNNTQKDHDKILRKPPGPPPPRNEISDYWKNRPQPFPMEDAQKHNASAIHGLLSAFVDAKPLAKSSESSTRDFTPMHVLLPRIELHGYMNYSFDERLEMELESAGLGKLPQDDGVERGVFADEIESYQKKLTEIQSSIEKIRNELIADLPRMHADHQRRMAEQRAYAATMSQLRPDQRRHRK